MKKLASIIKNYIKSSLDSLLTDQLASFVFSAIILWIIKKDLPIIDNANVPLSIKFLVLGVAFLIVYTISTFFHLRPDRFKFHIKTLDVIIEYLGDEVIVSSKYVFKTNRFMANRMYTRRVWYSDELFLLEPRTKGYCVKEVGKLGDQFDFYILFPQNQYFWQEKAFEVVFKGANKRRHFKNFYWYDVISPVDKISISVRIPRKCCTDKIKLKSFYDHESTIGNQVDEKDFNGAYQWTIDAPKLRWSYVLEWEWSEEEKRIIAEEEDK
jgi:hypothetical protein